MSPTELAALLAYATAMAFTPGPNTTLSAALAANHGLRHAMRFVVAVPFGWCLLLGASIAGLGTLVTTLPALGQVVRWTGAAYMLWLAWRLWSRRVASAATADRPADFDVGFARGVALPSKKARFVRKRLLWRALMRSSWPLSNQKPSKMAGIRPALAARVRLFRACTPTPVASGSNG